MRRICRLRERKAAVALIIALAAPLLIAATGLAVDVGYWYEQQEALQSATDAAAIAAATAADKYGVSTTNVAEDFALTAANEASNGQLALTSSALTLSTSSVMVNGTASTQWTANATIPRRGFFSAVGGLGLGTQTASAAADVVAATSPACLIATQGTISVTGGGEVVGTNCGIASNDTSGCSLSVTGSGKIIGTAVTTSASCVSVPAYSGYIGTNASATPAGSSSTVTLNAPAATDPLADLNPADTTSDGMSIWNPGWTTPSAPSETGSPVTPDLGYNTWDQTGVGDCLVLGDYNAGCELDPNYLTGMNSFGVASLLLNKGTSTGATYITGGFAGQSNQTTTLNGDDYYINGGMNVTSDSALTIGSSSQTSSVTMVVNGGTDLKNGSATLYPGTYYLNGAMSGSSYSGWGLTTDISSSLALEGPTYYVNGGIGITNGGPQMTLSSGLYELTSYAGNANSGSSSHGGAFYAGQGTYVFGNPVSADTTPAPNTYFFDGGLTISGGASSVTFNPGIYYIRNGNLDISSGPTVTGNGVTFVLEGNAGFTIDAGATVSFSAPTSNCIAPSNFPNPAYEGSAAPYDGTDGEGICGVLIYQSRGDATADNVTEGASGTFNGAIYAPDAPLTVSGAGAMTINTSGLPGLEVASISDSGSGNIHLTDTPTNGGSSGSTGGGVLLVH
jgi:Putative Flp pilus-assembly TadE/G-like